MSSCKFKLKRAEARAPLAVSGGTLTILEVPIIIVFRYSLGLSFFLAPASRLVKVTDNSPPIAAVFFFTII